MATRKKTTTKKRQGRKHVNATKTVIDGITFQSTLEGKMYVLLKEAGIKYTYEDIVYKTLEDTEYDNECWERARRTSKEMSDRRKVTGVKYTPDFVAPDESWVIEVKGRANESFPIRWKIFKNMVMKRRKNSPILFKPMNITDCRQVIEILLSKGYGQK